MTLKVEGDFERGYIYVASQHLWLLWYSTTAVSRATNVSYLLGKHETRKIFSDVCNEGQPYHKTLKLTGRGGGEDEFTCDEGQCIKMEWRCDQVQSLPPSFTTWMYRSFLLWKKTRWRPIRVVWNHLERHEISWKIFHTKVTFTNIQTNEKTVKYSTKVLQCILDL